ncbi:MULTISPECIES: alpha-xenorhabdolysin family binary toxin subunit A [Pseudomonas]|uniref:Binary cytotoxin component n=1 Tax=Pseudomonas saxonica TaxID=2600598 RepID=A0A5C5Q0E0_9PSED|nr:alpha-xenorhabdolysin family binary toxin subunit A [Pseudomonas saxonica]MCH4871875.1 binary cytotoxin component [Pseudomonas sp. TMW22091]TWR93101.1 binary cytotoxin component [Pseudomonas saxonica]TWR97727.1 binary cytotoxin component [Pseudomonas saxonica]
MNTLTIQSEAGSIESLSVHEAASYMPEQYLKVMSGATLSGIDKKELGFLIRRGDIANTRQYVRHVQVLPTRLQDVRQRLNYESIGVPELEPESIMKMHVSIVAHANTWSALEVGTKELARQLEKFSAEFLLFGNALLDLIKEVELGRRLTGTLEELTDQEHQKLSQMLLNATEKKGISSLKQYLTMLQERTQKFIKEVSHVEKLACVFETTLTDDLIPTLQIKLSAYKYSGKLGERDDWVDQIEELDEQIELLSATYKKLVGLAFSGMAAGPLGLVITGGVFGDKAEKCRKQKNQLIDKRRVAREKVREVDRVADLLDGLQEQFVDLQGRMFSAEVGAKQLSQVWAYIARYLDEASDELDQVDNMAELHLFALNLSLVINPWRSIKNYSIQISSAFNELVKP